MLLFNNIEFKILAVLSPSNAHDLLVKKKKWDAMQAPSLLLK